jgi:ribosomal protein S18 acetylase RimI-like enzyme
LTGTEDGGADGVLDALGYLEFDPSLTMVADIPADLERDPAVAITAAAKPRWIEAAAASYGGDKANADVLGRIVRRIRQPAAFATLSLDGDDVAWGLAVAERGYVGLYDIVVAPRIRGVGLGRRLVTSLMAWGRKEGAARAYLQVREANNVAIELYRSLGFAPAYRYRHRVEPGAFEPQAEEAAVGET